MPSHAIPRGPEGRALRRAARRRRISAGWRALPGVALAVTAVAVLRGPAASHGGVTGDALDSLWNTLGAVISVLIIAVIAVLRARLRPLRKLMADPRPRWQHIVAALCWLAVAGGCLIVALGLGSDHLLGRASMAAAFWSGVYSLVLVVRAARRRPRQQLL